jgi:hypothetical protein
MAFESMIDFICRDKKIVEVPEELTKNLVENFLF